MSAGNEISNWAVVDLGATDHIFYNEHEKNGERIVSATAISYLRHRLTQKRADSSDKNGLSFMRYRRRHH